MLFLYIKNGDPKQQENYRPISLLNYSYKLLADITQTRIQEGLENELQKTQYGFRKNKSTIQAIHCIRRLMDRAERTGEPLHTVLLDWEKAFDKITHTSLIKT